MQIRNLWFWVKNFRLLGGFFLTFPLVILTKYFSTVWCVQIFMKFRSWWIFETQNLTSQKNSRSSAKFRKMCMENHIMKAYKIGTCLSFDLQKQHNFTLYIFEIKHFIYRNVFKICMNLKWKFSFWQNLSHFINFSMTQPWQSAEI